MKKFIAMAIAAAGCALSAGAAHAGGHVSWSVGINVAPVGAVVTNAPVYLEPAPVYVEPAPVYYAPPPPVYYAPRVVYRPVPVYVAPPVVYRPAPVIYAGGYYPYHHYRGGWREGRHDEYGTAYRDDRWSDGRRHHHDN